MTWEDCLPYFEFSYNCTVHSTTQYSPFKVVYGFNLLMPLDLVPLPIFESVNLDGKKKANFIKQLHKKVHANIEKLTMHYATQANKGHRRVVFESGD